MPQHEVEEAEPQAVAAGGLQAVTGILDEVMREDAFFERLRERVIEAGKRDIYVGVMFFQGFSVKKPPASPRSGNNWHGNPFNKANNINGLDGRKIMVVDTDHCRAMKYDPVWAWTNFTRGNHFILMDSYMDFRVATPKQPDPKWDATRDAMGAARHLSEQLDLSTMKPMPDLASSRFCLANPGRTWIVFHTGGESLSVRTGPGKWHVAWLDSITGKEVSQQDLVVTGASMVLTPPAPREFVLLVTAIP